MYCQIINTVSVWFAEILDSIWDPICDLCHKFLLEKMGNHLYSLHCSLWICSCDMASFLYGRRRSTQHYYLLLLLWGPTYGIQYNGLAHVIVLNVCRLYASGTDNCRDNTFSNRLSSNCGVLQEVSGGEEKKGANEKLKLHLSVIGIEWVLM